MRKLAELIFGLNPAGAKPENPNGIFRGIFSTDKLGQTLNPGFKESLTATVSKHVGLENLLPWRDVNIQTLPTAALAHGDNKLSRGESRRQSIYTYQVFQFALFDGFKINPTVKSDGAYDGFRRAQLSYSGIQRALPFGFNSEISRKDTRKKSRRSGRGFVPS